MQGPPQLAKLKTSALARPEPPLTSRPPVCNTLPAASVRDVDIGGAGENVLVAGSNESTVAKPLPPAATTRLPGSAASTKPLRLLAILEARAVHAPAFHTSASSVSVGEPTMMLLIVPPPMSTRPS